MDTAPELVSLLLQVDGMEAGEVRPEYFAPTDRAATSRSEDFIEARLTVPRQLMENL